MVFRSLYTQVIFRVLLIVANALGFAFATNLSPRLYTLLFLAILLLVQAVLLIRYLNRTNRELSRFFASLKDRDSSFSLSPDDGQGTYGEIARVINETRQMLRDARIDKEKQYQYLRFMINHMEIGLLSFREEGQVIHFNSMASGLLGKESLNHISELESLSPGLSGMLIRMKPGQSKIVAFKREEEKRHLLFRMSAMKYDELELKLLTVQDMQNELDEQELLSWKRMIRAMNHEVLNSLTPIRTLSHAIRRSLDEFEAVEQNKDLMNDILRNVELIEQRSTELSEFVQSYREITRINEIRTQDVQVKSMMEDVKALFKKELNSQGIVCTIQVEPEVLSLRVDVKLMKQVMINLIKNSIEALSGSVEGSIHMSATATEGAHFIRIKDNGPGINEESMDEIFTPFFSTREKGSGIGLSFSRHIIRLHGGSLSAWSEPGAGTQMSISLP